jgi:hypothetical protein
MHRRLALVAAVAGCLCMAMAPAADTQAGNKDRSEKESPSARVTLWVDSKASLARHGEVMRALREIRGVRSIGTHPGSPRLKIGYDPGECKPGDLVRAVERVGYAAKVVR